MDYQTEILDIVKKRHRIIKDSYILDPNMDKALKFVIKSIEELKGTDNDLLFNYLSSILIAISLGPEFIEEHVDYLYKTIDEYFQTSEEGYINLYDEAGNKMKLDDLFEKDIQGKTKRPVARHKKKTGRKKEGEWQQGR